MKTTAKNKIVVAMSGGVDSSVAAALLKKRGYFVMGVFMKFWLGSPKPAGVGGKGYNSCCSVESEKMARAVAKQLDIPFYVLNVEKEFKKKVVDYFLKEYKAGNTPNPCVVCNKEIKFGLLIKKALKMGANYVATGHYVRVSRGNQIFSNRSPNQILEAKDKNKDQSYFLWQLNQKQLEKVLFPVGNYTKPKVRALAKKFNLPTAETPESQEVCFVPASPAGRQNATNNFLEKYLKTKPGKIILRTNSRELVIGAHKGLWFYTIGQRKGIGLSGGPFYVVAKDFKKNNLIVSKNKNDLLQKELAVKNVNWLSGKPPKFPIKVLARIRYRNKLAKATIFKFQTSNFKLLFDCGQKAVTPGQSVVFYLPRRSSKAKECAGNELLGGGIIDR